MNFQITRLSAAALAMSMALGAGAALAQNAQPAPAAPAGAAQPAPGQHRNPVKVDLVSPEPQWVKLCGKEQTTGRDACPTMRDFATSADQPPMISIQVFELQGEEKRKLRFMMLPIGMLLKPGFRVVVDKTEPIEGKYDMCFQNACPRRSRSAQGACEPEKGPEPRGRDARSGRRPFGPRAHLQHSVEGFRADFRRQADRSQSARAAAPGAAAAVAEEGGRAAQGARAAAAEQRRRAGRPRLRLPLRLLRPRRNSNAARWSPPADQREATALRTNEEARSPMASAPFYVTGFRGGHFSSPSLQRGTGSARRPYARIAR